nr:hypothetical protein [uncultured Draconibacterium sp.]
MKQVLSLTGILALALFFSSAISINEAPQDPPKTKKEKKHIKMVKVGDDGKKMEIDTVITANQVFVWNGDTIGGGKELSWISEGDFDFDIDFDMETNENGKVFILKGKGASEPMIYKFRTDDGDSTKHITMKVISDDVSSDIMQWHSKNDNEMIFGAPGSATPQVIRIDKQKSGNVIDLSDPGIVSFEKKDLKNGKEKIVIIREKPSEEDVEVHEEIIMHNSSATPMIIHEGMPTMTKRIKVIADDEGHIEILEDGKTWAVEESDEDTQVIEEGGKKIIIKKTKKDGEMKVDVEVEEEVEEN